MPLKNQLPDNTIALCYFGYFSFPHCLTILSVNKSAVPESVLQQRTLDQFLLH